MRTRFGMAAALALSLVAIPSVAWAHDYHGYGYGDRYDHNSRYDHRSWREHRRWERERERRERRWERMHRRHHWRNWDPYR